MYKTTKLFLPGLLSLILSCLPVSVQAADKDEVAQLFIARSNKVVEQLMTLEQQGALDSLSARAVIQEHMSPLLNFELLTRRAMGKFWRRATDEEKQGIVAAFRSLLENTYAKVLSRYSGQRVELLEAKDLGDEKVSVVLKVQGEGKSAEIDYIMEKDAAGMYKASDVKIEKISMISNYRRQFKSIISKSGEVSGLLEKLQKMAAKKIK